MYIMVVLSQLRQDLTSSILRVTSSFIIIIIIIIIAQLSYLTSHNCLKESWVDSMTAFASPSEYTGDFLLLKWISLISHTHSILTNHHYNNFRKNLWCSLISGVRGYFFVCLRGQDKAYIQNYHLFQKTTINRPIASKGKKCILKLLSSYQV